MKRVVFFLFFTVFTMRLGAQTNLQKDTIHLKEVIINRNSAKGNIPGFRVKLLDSVVINDYNLSSLTDLLNDNSSLFIKSYGAGGIATPAFRGTSAGHTRVLWNNINIDNPMAGQFDFSLVPAGLVDNIEINYGGGSIGLNSGGFGGIINLKTNPDWKNRFSVLINPGIGSYGKYTGLVKLKVGNPGFQSETKVFYESSENNFPYLNSISPSEPFRAIRQNNHFAQTGFIQELYYKGSKGFLSAKFWYQSTFRNLPEPIINLPVTSGEKQKDESFRTVISYERSTSRKEYNLTVALISDNLNYTNRLASIDSKNSTSKIYLKDNFALSISEKFKIKTEFSNELSVINSNNYAGRKIRNLASVSGIAETYICSWLGANLIFREILQNNKFLIPDFSIGSQIRIFPEKEFYINASFSRNSKIPALNDLYWIPGGKPDLKNESCYSSEFGFELSRDLSSSIKIISVITLYHNSIFNMILWHPGEYSFWEPDNLKSIKTSGIESEVRLLYKAPDFNIVLNAGYTFTKAAPLNGTYSEKQIIYVPVHRINSVLKLNWKRFFSGVITTFTSRRFLTPDNIQYLPQYSVTDLDIGCRFGSARTPCNFSLRIINLFNINYQNIAWYPMPGRAYLLSCTFQFKKS